MKLNELKKQQTKNTTPFGALFKLERKLNLKSLLLFTAICAWLIVITFAIYPIMKEQFSQLPNIPAELLGLQDVNSYFTMQIGQNWILLALIIGSYLGYQLVAGNFRNGSSVFLYTQNLSRNQILGAKFLRMLINIVIFNVICAIVGFIGVSILEFGAVDILNYLIYTLLMILMSLQMGILMFGLTTIYLKKIAPFFSFALPILLMVFSSLSYISESVEFLKYLSPSSVMTSLSSNILITGFNSVDFISLGVWTLIPLIVLISGIINFNKKDLI